MAINRTSLVATPPLGPAEANAFNQLDAFIVNQEADLVNFGNPVTELDLGAPESDGVCRRASSMVDAFFDATLHGTKYKVELAVGAEALMVFEDGQLAVPTTEYKYATMKTWGVSKKRLIISIEGEEDVMYVCKKAEVVSEQMQLQMAEIAKIRRSTKKAAQPSPQPVADWDVAAVQAWLAASGLQKHTELFSENAIDGEMLLTLTLDELQEELEITDEVEQAALLEKLDAQRDLENSRSWTCETHRRLSADLETSPCGDLAPAPSPASAPAANEAEDLVERALERSSARASAAVAAQSPRSSFKKKKGAALEVPAGTGSTMYDAKLKGKKVQLQPGGMGLQVFVKGRASETYMYQSLESWSELPDKGIEIKPHGGGKPVVFECENGPSMCRFMDTHAQELGKAAEAETDDKAAVEFALLVTVGVAFAPLAAVLDPALAGEKESPESADAERSELTPESAALSTE